MHKKKMWVLIWSLVLCFSGCGSEGATSSEVEDTSIIEETTTSYTEDSISTGNVASTAVSAITTSSYNTSEEDDSEEDTSSIELQEESSSETYLLESTSSLEENSQEVKEEDENKDDANSSLEEQTFLSFGNVDDKKQKIEVENMSVSAYSVSSIEILWDGEEGRGYEITVSTDQPTEGADNLYIEVKSNSLVYATGLKEASSYSITVKPQLLEGETDDSYEAISTTMHCSTLDVETFYDFPYVEGWTNCFAYENAKGLTASPSKDWIAGCFVDPVTNTGIMRNSYGDYCVAMGTYYGYCGDRFLIELENGTQFTVQICDSKGNVEYHDFGNGGKCVIEFIHGDGSLPSCVGFTGNYGSYNWYGLNFANIKSISKIA